MKYNIEKYKVDVSQYPHSVFQVILQQSDILYETIWTENTVNGQKVDITIDVIQGQKAVCNGTRIRIWNSDTQKDESQNLSYYMPVIDTICCIYNQEHSFL